MFLRAFEFSVGNTIANCSSVHVNDVTGEGTKVHRGWAQDAQFEQKWIRDCAPNPCLVLFIAPQLSAPWLPLGQKRETGSSILLNIFLPHPQNGLF